MTQPRPSRLQALGLLAIAPALAAVAPSPSAAGAGLTTGSADTTAPLLAAVALATWACTAWLLLVAVVTCGDRLPGAAGLVARRASSRIAPASVRTLVRVAIGTSVAASVFVGPAALAADRTPSPAGTAAPSATSATSATTATVTGPAAGVFDWPSKGPASSTASPATVSSSAAAPVTAPHRSTVNPATVSSTAAAPATAPHHSSASGAPSATNTPARRLGAAPPADVVAVRTGEGVVVRAGDSLWSIAAQALGPGVTDRQVAQAWPQWWSANRAVLGDDPDLIQPGTHLSAPQP